MRKSRAETAQTRGRIVLTAAKMFLEKGLSGVGMRDIMGAARLTQGGFYRHFASKEQLIAEANGTAFDRLHEMLADETRGMSPPEAVKRILALYLGQSRGKKQAYRCPLAMLGAELSHSDRQVRAVAMKGYQRLVQLVADQFGHLARREALVRASGIVSTLVGAVTLAEIAPDPATAKAILSNARALIKDHIPLA
jgi:TetR/AcrR family transcriptional regulator, transcriptional repressor for nem operon